MSSQTQSDPFNRKYEECMRMHHCWPWFLILGICLMVVGVLAMGAPLLTSLATVGILGGLLLAGGVVQIVNAFMARSWGGFFGHLLAAILHVIVGVLFIERPLRAAEALTLMLAVAFLVGGLFRVIVAFQGNFSGNLWVLLNGVITFALGVAIWRRWPEASYWVIGLFVGIDLIFNGWTWVMLALVVKSARPGSPVPESAPNASIPAGVK
jgi:uncharacterized membrane protein HdeD (DUF308 family)